MRNPDQHSAITDAIEVVGSQAELASRCGCAQQTISKLLNKENAITPQMAIAISRATNGKISIGALYPDLVRAVTDELAQPTPEPTREVA